MALEHLIVASNRAAQFAARFEAQDDGSFIYFHPNGHGGGLPCSRAEMELLIGEFASSERYSMRGAVYWVIGAGIALGLLEASGTLVLPRWAQYAIFLAPFLLTLQVWHHASQRPLQLLGGRIPAAPPRTAPVARHVRLAALPAGVVALMLLPAAGLTYYATQTGWEIVQSLIVASNLLIATAWLLARRKLRAAAADSR
ncbi:MAG: hypothetical protein PHQ60_07510 [Sideroxydans sp.]|nr:hypothetical protein [Sideroxydans sp.]